MKLLVASDDCSVYKYTESWFLWQWVEHTFARRHPALTCSYHFSSVSSAAEMRPGGEGLSYEVFFVGWEKNYFFKEHWDKNTGNTLPWDEVIHHGECLVESVKL